MRQIVFDMIVVLNKYADLVGTPTNAGEEGTEEE
jgi:hypothetical protein